MAGKIKSSKKHRSKIPPPTWRQVAWLMGGGGLQLFLTFLMSLYDKEIETRETVSGFDELFGGAYSLMIFFSLIGVSALILGLWKIFLLVRIRRREKMTARPSQRP